MSVRSIARGARHVPDRQEYVRAMQRIGGDNLVGYWPLDDASGTSARELGPNGEVLTISGCTLGQSGPPGMGRSHYFDGINDVDSQCVYDDQTGASWGTANHGLSLADGVAFLRTAGVDLSGFAGVEGSSTPYMVALTDSASKVSWGYVGAADAAEALGAAKGLTGITKANPGVVTFNAGHGYSNGMLIKFSGLTEMTELNSKYCTLAGNVGDTFTIVDTSGYGAAETTGGNCAQQVTHVGTDGVHIVSTRNGSTRNWAGIEAGFNYNDTAYTFEVRKSLFQITGALTVGAWVKLSSKGANNPIIYKIDTASAATVSWGLNCVASSGLFTMTACIPAINTVTDTAASRNTGEWYHVVGTHDGAQVVIYVNGVVAGAAGAIGTIQDVHTAVTIGNRPNGGVLNLPYHGNIAHAFVINRALTAAEIASLHRMGRRIHSG